MNAIWFKFYRYLHYMYVQTLVRKVDKRFLAKFHK